MKSLFTVLSVSLLVSAGAFAAAPSLELNQLARILVNTDVTAQLKKAGTDSLSDLEVVKVQDGVNEYRMEFRRNCECIPATAKVSIVEDMRPTFSDGAPIYKSSVVIENSNR